MSSTPIVAALVAIRDGWTQWADLWKMTGKYFKSKEFSFFSSCQLAKKVIQIGMSTNKKVVFWNLIDFLQVQKKDRKILSICKILNVDTMLKSF